MPFTVFALLTCLALISVLWPLLRRRKTRAANEIDIAFYQAQLTEIERDKEAGQVTEPDAEAAKIAAARRLMNAAEAQPDKMGKSVWLPRLAAVFAVIAIPALAFALYSKIGHPNLPDEPLLARMKSGPEMGLMAAVAKVEEHLHDNPNDGHAYEILAPIYLRMGRADEAINAYQKTIALLGDSAERRSDYGEALAYIAGGRVIPEAQKAFTAALLLDPHQPKAQFYLGAAAAQEGDKAKAKEIWENLIASSPTGAPWLTPVRENLAELEGSTAAAVSQGGVPQGEEARAIAQLPEADRNATIRSMVDRLASRLAQNGQDIEGWLRLMRAYTVLQEADKAKTAHSDARKNMTGNSEAMSRIDALARELGLEG